MQWYYAIDGQRLGPVSHSELERLILAGTVTGDALIWRQGMDQWKTLDDVRTRDPAMFAAPAPPPLPDPAPTASAELDESVARTRRPMRLELEPERPAPPEVLLYAGFWRRAAAFLVDLVIWSFVWNLFSNIIARWLFPEAIRLQQVIEEGGGPFRYQTTPDEMAVLVGYSTVVMLVGLTWAVVYDLFFVLKYSATPGKMLLGLRLVRANNKPLGALRVIARCLAKGLSGLPTFGIGFVVAAFDDQKRALHDFVCGTRVVLKKKD